MQEHRTRARTQALLGLAVVGALFAAWTVLAGPAHGQSTYSAQSSATAVHLGIGNSELPLVTGLELGGPTAGASLSSNGQGAAFAANPTPGETVAGLPATVAGLTGLPIPAYPFYVATTTGDDRASFKQAGLSLDASCGPDVATLGCRGTTVVGEGPGTVRATASVVQVSDDEVRAVAQADLPEMTLPGGLTVAAAHSAASVVLKDGKLTRTSTLTVTGLAAAGTPVFHIENGRAHVAGSAAPVPFSEVTKALMSAGVEAQLFSARQSDEGVVAPVLRLRTPLPGAPVGVTKPSDVVLTIGGAHAAVGLGGFQPSVAVGQARGGASTPAGAAPVAPPPLGTPGVAVGPQDGSAPLVPPQTGTTADPASPVLASAPRLPTPTSFRVAEIYLALVVSALVWLGSTLAARVFGVRLQWMS